MDPLQNLFGGILDPLGSSSSDEDPYIPSVYSHLLDELDSDSDDVLLTRAAALNRDRAAAHELLYNHYFAENCVYNDESFKRRYRLSRNLFLRIHDALQNRYQFFQQRSDVRGRMGFTGLQKCTAALRMMAYGISADGYVEYLQMSERTVRESMYQFSRGVVEIFGEKYLRGPTTHDVEKLYAAHEERHGFPGMLGSLDCTHWDWRNCPTKWKGMYTGGHHKVPSLVLEAVASQDLWFWHAYFGVPGSNNDRNVLDSSHIFEDVIKGKAPEAPFHVNGHVYKYPYYLTDDIYPRFATFVKGKKTSHEPREKIFTKRQAAARKDVERAFGVLKAKWHIVLHAARPYHLDNLQSIMYACVIMHNMIIEEEGRQLCPFVEEDPRPILYPVGSEEYRRRYVEIQDARVHVRLHDDLVTHIHYNPRNVDDDEDDPPVIPDVAGQFADVPDYELPVDDDESEDYDDVVDDD